MLCLDRPRANPDTRVFASRAVRFGQGKARPTLVGCRIPPICRRTMLDGAMWLDRNGIPWLTAVALRQFPSRLVGWQGKHEYSSTKVVLLSISEHARLSLRFVGSSQVVVVSYRVEVYAVGADVGVDAVAMLDDQSSYQAPVPVKSTTYIVISPDSLSVRERPGFVVADEQICCSAGQLHVQACSPFTHDL